MTTLRALRALSRPQETLFAYCQRLAKERGGAALAGQRVWCYWWAQPNGVSSS